MGKLFTVRNVLLNYSNISLQLCAVLSLNMPRCTTFHNILSSDSFTCEPSIAHRTAVGPVLFMSLRTELIITTIVIG